MKNVRFGALVLIALTGTIAIACGAAAASPTSPSAASGNTSLTAGDVAGTWQLVEIQRVEQAARPVPEGATYRITFDGNRVSTRQDCNVCSGTVVVTDQNITIGPALACTKAACPTMDYETVFESILAGDSSVTLQGRSLTLSSKRGVLRFTR